MTSTGRIVLCCGMPRSGSTLQYQLALYAAERTAIAVAAGWYDGTPLPELLEQVPDGEIWVLKVHGYRDQYQFAEASETGRVLGLSIWRDVRKVIESYRELHDKSMWWIARHRVLEQAIADHRSWSKESAVLMQPYSLVTADIRSALNQIGQHIEATISQAELDEAAVQFGRSAQVKLSADRNRDAAGTNRPQDLLLGGHVSGSERSLNPDFDTAWVESVGRHWLAAEGLEPTTSRSKQRLARLRYSPRLLWFLKWHLTNNSMGTLAASRLRRARSWARYAAERLALAPELSQREIARVKSLANRRTQQPGETVVMVSWNSEDIIGDTLRLVQRFSPAGTPIIVVDNGSDDGTRTIARQYDNVTILPLRRNVGHGLAMDLGFLAARTDHVVALDVDAFPIADHWLTDMRDRLDAGAEVAGAEWRRHVGFYIHPCCLMMRRSRFISRRHSFMTRFLPGVDPSDEMGVRYWDAGEKISMREGAKNLSAIPMSSSKRFCSGMVFGDIVYHNGATTRAVDADTWQENGGIAGAVDMWRDAVDQYSDPIDLRAPAAGVSV